MDLAFDPAQCELFVTDSFSDQIFVYNTDLTLESVLSTLLPNLVGIAFNSNADELIVSRSGSNSLTRLNPLTGAFVGSANPLGTQFTAITYDELGDTYRLIDPSATPPNVVCISASSGSFCGSFSPPLVTGLEISDGLCHLPASDTYLVTTKPAGAGGGGPDSMTELFPNGFPTAPSFPLAAVGSSGSIRGIEVVGGVLYLTGGTTNTIFRMLLPPGGTDFVRGDATGDQVIDLSDIISIASYLFGGCPAPTCLDAADAIDTGDLDISDPLFLILYLFIGGTSPPPVPLDGTGPDSRPSQLLRDGVIPPHGVEPPLEAAMINLEL